MVRDCICISSNPNEIHICQIVNLNIFQITNIFREFSLKVLILLLKSAKLIKLQSFTVELRQ